MSGFLENAGVLFKILGNAAGEVKRNGPGVITGFLDGSTVKNQEEAKRRQMLEDERRLTQQGDNRFSAWAAAAKEAQQRGMRIPELPYELYTRAHNAGLIDLARQANPRALAAQDAMHFRALTETKEPLTEVEQSRLNALARHLYLQAQQQQQQPTPQNQPQIQPQMQQPQTQPQMQQPTEFKPQSRYDDPALEEERLRGLAQSVGLSQRRSY